MKLSHNWNGWGRDRTDPAWSARVEAEAQRTTDAVEAEAQRHAERLARAEQRLAASRAKLARAERERQRKSTLHRIAREVETRRLELVALHREMQQSPAGSQHRGIGSHRGVATGDVL